MEKYTLGLSMIVKDEHHVIERVLNSVYKHIDYWVIVDTGSTDGTQKLVTDFFETKRIPGELIEIEWKDFSTSRNVALESVEKMCKWGMWIDADEEYIAETSSLLKDRLLTCADEIETVSLMTKYGSIDYTRKNIWRCGIGFNWSGPIHELLSREGEKAGTVFNSGYVLVKPEGNSWKNVQGKYAEHAKILEAYTLENNDPRWVFYTAQSYRDSNQYLKALEWYRKRAEITTGFYEEIYISKLMIAKLAEVLKWPKQDAMSLYNDAHKTDPLRGESLKYLILYLHGQKDWELSYVYSSYALRYNLKNPYPNRILFIDYDCYQYQLLELHAISCYYTKRYDEGSKSYWMMRNQLPKTINQEVLKRIENNAQYYTPKETLK